jgi:hypothetical protein
MLSNALAINFSMVTLHDFKLNFRQQYVALSSCRPTCASDEKRYFVLLQSCTMISCPHRLSPRHQPASATATLCALFSGPVQSKERFKVGFEYQVEIFFFWALVTYPAAFSYLIRFLAL